MCRYFYIKLYYGRANWCRDYILPKHILSLCPLSLLRDIHPMAIRYRLLPSILPPTFALPNVFTDLIIVARVTLGSGLRALASPTNPYGVQYAGPHRQGVLPQLHFS